METLHTLLVVTHLAGMGLLLGGSVLALQQNIPFPALVLLAARIQLASGLFLTGFVQQESAGDMNMPKILGKLLLSFIIAGIAEAGARSPEKSATLLTAITWLTCITIAVAVSF